MTVACVARDNWELREWERQRVLFAREHSIHSSLGWASLAKLQLSKAEACDAINAKVVIVVTSIIIITNSCAYLMTSSSPVFLPSGSSNPSFLRVITASAIIIIIVVVVVVIIIIIVVIVIIVVVVVIILILFILSNNNSTIIVCRYHMLRLCGYGYDCRYYYNRENNVVENVNDHDELTCFRYSWYNNCCQTK